MPKYFGGIFKVHMTAPQERAISAGLALCGTAHSAQHARATARILNLARAHQQHHALQEHAQATTLVIITAGFLMVG